MEGENDRRKDIVINFRKKYLASTGIEPGTFDFYTQMHYRLLFATRFYIKDSNQLLQLCTARTAWSESDQTVRTVHSCNSWWLALLWSESVIKLVSVLFGKCTTLMVTKCWPMVIRQPCGDQWKAEKLGAFWRWPITRCLIKSDSSYLNYRAHCKFCLIRQQSRAVQFFF